MVYLLKMGIFHGELLNNQMVYIYIYYIYTHKIHALRVDPGLVSGLGKPNRS
jgi:hypothetical protein